MSRQLRCVPYSTAARDTYFADFLFGAPSQYALSRFFVAYLRQNQHDFYVQDDWKLGSKMTFNLGARWFELDRASRHSPYALQLGSV